MSDVETYAAEAAALRNRIADSVEALGERLSPSRLVQDAKDEGIRAFFSVRDDGLKRLHKVRDEGNRVLAELRDSCGYLVDEAEGFVRDNPVAAGAAAAFVGVLLVHNRPRRIRPIRPDYDDGDRYLATASRPTSRLRRYAAGVGETVSGTRGRLGKSFGSVKDSALDALAATRDRVSATASDLADQARAGLNAARSHASAAASDTSDRIAVGLDSARDRATDAVTRASRAADDAATATGSAIQEQPEAALAIGLIAGAFLALAAENGVFDSGS